jgi:hypothetical protein
MKVLFSDANLVGSAGTLGGYLSRTKQGQSHSVSVSHIYNLFETAPFPNLQSKTKC